MIRLIAFLGNYGNEYAHTRHNAGWLFADTIPAVYNASWQHKFKGQFASVPISEIISSGDDALTPDTGGESSPLSAVPKTDKVFVIKPETYMNLSGESVGCAASFHRIKAEEILVVHDELELPVGTMSLKWSGGLGGHNGLRSMKNSLGTADFWRIRFGIGRPERGDVAEYVLSPFTEDEKISLALSFEAGRECLKAVLTAKDASRLIPKWGKKKCIQ